MEDELKAMRALNRQLEKLEELSVSMQGFVLSWLETKVKELLVAGEHVPRDGEA